MTRDLTPEARAALYGAAPAQAVKKAVDENPPRPYDLDDPKELQRLYRECRGYLHTCHRQHGTDWEGRRFAMEALETLATVAAVLASRKEER